MTELHRLPGCNVGGLNTETHHIVWCCIEAEGWWDRWGSGLADWETLSDVVGVVACELLSMPTTEEREAAIEAWWQRDRITPL